MFKNPLLTLAALVAVGALMLTDYANKNADASVSDGSSDGPATAFVRKLQGILYFGALTAGGEAAAVDLGFIWLHQGSTTADAAAQADSLRSFIQQKVDALIVAPNNRNSMAPLLKQVQNAANLNACIDVTRKRFGRAA